MRVRPAVAQVTPPNHSKCVTSRVHARTCVGAGAAALALNLTSGVAVAVR